MNIVKTIFVIEKKNKLFLREEKKQQFGFQSGKIIQKMGWVNFNNLTH